MENYAPFLAKNWQSIALFAGATLATGMIVVRSFQRDTNELTKSQDERRSGSWNKQVARAKRHELPDEDSPEDDNEDYEDDAPGPDENNAMRIAIQYSRPSEEQSILKSKEFYNKMNARRSIREISSDPVPLEVIENIIKTAGTSYSRSSTFKVLNVNALVGTSPSGAHTQPWTFVVVGNREVKQQIRAIIEAEEEVNYRKRMGINPFSGQWMKQIYDCVMK